VGKGGGGGKKKKTPWGRKGKNAKKREKGDVSYFSEKKEHIDQNRGGFIQMPTPVAPGEQK